MPLTTTGQEDALRQELMERWLLFVKIAHSSIPSPPFSGNEILLTFNNESLVADFGDGAKTYLPAPMQIAFHSSIPDGPPRAHLVVHATNDLIQGIRTLTSQPVVNAYLALESDLPGGSPPVPKQREAVGILGAIGYDSFSIEAPILPPQRRQHAQSRHQFTPNNNPPLFGV